MGDDIIQELRQILPQCMLPDWVRIGSRLVRVLRDRRHVGMHPAVITRLLDQARASAALRERRRLNLPEIRYEPALPITARKDEIVRAIRENQVVVIAGETGSGKTTQIPKMCLEAGLGIEAKIGCTQPRRVAALSISRRIAEELNLEWGRGVGCKIRFDDRSSPETYIKLMTDGILLAETQGDPDLSEYNAIIIDEAHERSLNIDFLLGHLKGLLARRKDLKVVITSATIDTVSFSQAFDNAPIIEVSGRMFPVEVIYDPLQSEDEDAAEVSFIDGAVRAVERVIYESSDGDILIFMPGERDIRETSDLLTGRFSREAEIIPLFGRLGAGDQQRVFAPSDRRKIVIATNIAETSLTIPGIRYVIDSGLARISRYNPRTRTKRLPIEPVSQSSANQRKGRSGRVQNGVCIRLYSQEDFEGRPAYTQPEIQRANLAEVILRMKAFRLGDIETFPFVNPPSPAAIDGGYKLLQELGALDEDRALTGLGRDLARLPIDPTLGRMLLQSEKEHATRELLIIASGLSIQDPRERPMDQKEAAAQAHKRFADAGSDFISLLNLWKFIHENWETVKTQGQRRKFCRTHFLSYLRIREWQDLHAQLTCALDELGVIHLENRKVERDAIHRSILAGLLGHVACREERNRYKAVGNRQVLIFPGSALYDRQDRTATRSSGHGLSRGNESKFQLKQPGWVVAGEIVETSQLFARTVAAIDPQWIVQLGAHVCKVTHQNPHWSPAAGKVLVDEKVTLYGLEVFQRKAVYGNIAPEDATAIFIRSALVEENLLPPRPEGRDREDEAAFSRAGKPSANQLLASAKASQSGTLDLPPAYAFVEHNRSIRHKIETWQTRVRRHDIGDVDQALFDFYSARIKNVSSLHELNRWVREQTNPAVLLATEHDLSGGMDLQYDNEAFPDSVNIGGQQVGLAYAYAPGEDSDGVTVRIPVELAKVVPPSAIDWVVPGLREEQAGELLRALPKTLRRELMPLPPKAKEIAREFVPSGPSLLEDLGRFIFKRYGIEVTADSWSGEPLPVHLKPRIEIFGDNQIALRVGRDLDALRKGLDTPKPKPAASEPPHWRMATERWERFGLTGWTIGDVPSKVIVVPGSQEVLAWPGLAVEDENVCLRLFRNELAARAATEKGIPRLLELELQKDLAWARKDLRALAAHEASFACLNGAGDLQEDAYANLLEHVVGGVRLGSLTERAFLEAAAGARGRLRNAPLKLNSLIAQILSFHKEITDRFRKVEPSKPSTKKAVLNDFSQLSITPVAVPSAAPKSSPILEDLALLVPGDFLRRIPFERLESMPRYLRALSVRSERAALNPVKDRERVQLVDPWARALKNLELAPVRTAEGAKLTDEFRWLLEEYRISVFAQEIGTQQSVSPKRLEEALMRARQAG